MTDKLQHTSDSGNGNSKRRFSLVPTLSFDGIAIILAVLAGFFRLGQISTKIDTQADNIKQIQTTVDKVETKADRAASKAEQIGEDVKVLSAIINERSKSK